MLEKQYSRIIRWVHRAQSMSADGNFSDAILDVECARAELEDARQELLLCHKSGSERRSIPSHVLVLAGALTAVFVWATPLQPEKIQPHSAAELATQSKKALIEKKDTRSNPSVALTVEGEEKTVSVNGPNGGGAQVVNNVLDDKIRMAAKQNDFNAKVGDTRAEQNVSPFIANSSAAVRRNTRNLPLRVSQKLSEDDMYRLTEVGRKALRRKQSVEVWELN